MRYTPEIQQRLIEQIEREPGRPVILPDWAYWKDMDEAWIYVDSMPTKLIRHLYEVIIGALAPQEGVANPPGVDIRNVNPHLAVRLPTRRSRAACPKGHRYADEDYTPGVGHECQVCRAAHLLGTPSVADTNRAKTRCPKGHKLVKRTNGRRRCMECPREQTRHWRENRTTA